MKQNQKQFLSQFDQPLRKHIINFCNTISKTKYDVYILLARKAACFIDTLIELDLVEINGTIVSDRVLEYNTDWLKGKSIAIVDDTIISGTSIFKLIQKLEEIFIKKIDVFAFCINEYWYVEEMLETSNGNSYLKEPYLKLDHSSSLKFCKNIVESLAISPRPYNIDFPIYENIKFSSTKLDKLFDSSFWKIVETTSTKQKEHNIFCFTLNPTKKFIEKYEHDLGWKISEIAHYKLRLYTHKNIDNQSKTTYITKVVPYIIFNPISNENSKEIINSIIKHENIDQDELFSQLKTVSSNLILIQYYYAEKLFQTWLKCLDTEIDISNKYYCNKRSLYFLFNPKIIDILASIHFEEAEPFSNMSTLFLSDQILFDKSKTELNPIENLNNLIQPFLDLYYKKELPARRIVKRLNKSAFQDFSYIDVVNRLDDGISVNELKTILSRNINNISDANQIVSLFLDKYIDNGIIVPITVSKNGFVYRGFRHGEEIIWGNYNNRLLGKYFEKYLKYINSETISETYFQKLLVLFLKIGLKESVLEEYSTLTPRNIKTKLLSVKAHLFGLVSDYTELEPNETKIHLPIIDPNIKSYWTSKFLQDYEIISIKDKKVEFNFERFDKPYTSDIDDNEPTDIDPSDIDKIFDIADTFGYLRLNKQLNEKELVLLTSCVNLHDNTASLAAELQIYLNRFGSYRHKLLNGKKNDFTLENLKSLRDVNVNYIWTAMNSGFFKFSSYIRNEGLTYINKVEKYFEENGKQSEARIWRRYWRTDVELSKNEINELNLTNCRMGQLLLEANLAFTIVHIIIFELLARQNKIDFFIQNINKEIEKIKKQISSINEKVSEFNKKNSEFIDSVLKDALLKERTILNNSIKNHASSIHYWENYIKSNLAFIESLKTVFFSLNIPIKNSTSLAKTSNGFYKHLHSNELEQLLQDNITFLDELADEIKSIMEDYKLTVPEWGKIQQKVRCNNFIHINSNVSDTKIREHISKIIRHYLSEFEIEEFGNESEHKTINLLRISNAETGLGQIIGVRGQFAQERLIKLSSKFLFAFKQKNTPIFISVYPDLRDHGVDIYFNNQTKNFDIVKVNLFEELENNTQLETAIIYDKNGRHNMSEFIHYKFKNLKDDVIISEGNSTVSKYPNYIIKLNMNIETVKTTIGIVTALPKEFAAVRCILDSEITSFQKPSNDTNDYAIGYINCLDKSQIKVVIALMKVTGTNNASSTATHLLRTFTDIDDIIVCGIAGGVPNINKADEHVRLGDIVVCDKNGVLQYDNIKETEDEIKIRDASSKPSAKLLGIVNLLKAEYEINNLPWIAYIKLYEGKLRNSNRPEVSKDILKIKGYPVSHPIDKERIENEPKVFHGPIGSSNTLLKNEVKRDFLRDKYSIKAIEMEGSGIADGTWSLSKGYLIIRGIVDYCNFDKNDEWHNYAAICAASYTKAIIERL